MVTTMMELIAVGLGIFVGFCLGYIDELGNESP
jgi:hypothetical protein